jgi:hypothetical protein
LQTLALWNDPQFVEAAVHLGQRAVACGGDPEQVELLFMALASRPPTEVERAAALDLLDAQRAAYRADLPAAHALARYDLERIAHPPAAGTASKDTSVFTDAAAVDIASAAVLASALLTLDDVVTRR